MQRVFNFSAGPSMLPLPVLEKMQKDLLSYDGCGQSVMEMSHRSPVYDSVFKASKQNIIDTLCIPDSHELLFIQGGASMQFDMLAANLTVNGKADYIVTGEFSGKAAKAAKKFTEVNILATSEADNFTYIPSMKNIKPSEGSDYLHLCYNNTIFGSVFSELPDCGDVPIIADMSSCIMSEPVDVARFGMIYAGAQKNMGPAGLAVVIIDKKLLSRSAESLPTMQNYNTYVKSDSMFNTPPTFAIYAAGLVADWVKNTMGGLEKMAEHNHKKAAILYNYIDGSSLFKNPVRTDCRSMMNVTFTTENDELNNRFCKEATATGLVNLKGHRLVGGMRASIYNAMPIEGVQALVDFMKGFEANV